MPSLTIVNRGDIICDEPILAVSPKLGLNRVRANGKHAKTLFKKLKYNAERGYSIVECHPFTGRTHQIRVHLQYLGYPISNDPIYCNRKVWGPNLGKGGEGEDEDIITRLNRMGKEEAADAMAYFDEMVYVDFFNPFDSLQSISTSFCEIVRPADTHTERNIKKLKPISCLACSAMFVAHRFIQILDHMKFVSSDYRCF